MQNKLRKQIIVHKNTQKNKAPNILSQKFIRNAVRARRAEQTSPLLRGALGFAIRLLTESNHGKGPRAFRSECFITGRSRGVSRRLTVARTKVKELTSQARLFGVRKSS